MHGHVLYNILESVWESNSRQSSIYAWPCTFNASQSPPHALTTLQTQDQEYAGLFVTQCIFKHPKIQNALHIHRYLSMCVTTAIPRVNSTPVNAAPSTNPPHNMDHLQRLAQRLSLVDELFTTISQTNQSVQAPWDEIGPIRMQGNKELNKANKNTSRQKYVDGGKVQEKNRDQRAKTSKRSIHLWCGAEGAVAPAAV